MKNQDFTTSILVEQPPKEAFKAIINPRGWWSEEIEGDTDNLNDVFHYHFEDVHSCQIKLIEIVPGRKVVWLIQDNHFNFTKDKTEWVDTKVVFEISTQGEKTQVRFTHLGLVPDYECYDACHQGWTHYIQKSLQNFITTGKGEPNKTGKAQTETEKKLISK